MNELTHNSEMFDGCENFRLACSLGAGRSNPEDKLDHSVGVLLTKNPGIYI